LDRLTAQNAAAPVEEVWGQVTTGANGRYEFAGLPAGAYAIRLAEYGALEPTTPSWVAVNVAAGVVTYEVSFGLRQPQPHLYLPLIRAR
jgi:protocatechuate 3,4-dioxygenase beta subunit